MITYSDLFGIILETGSDKEIWVWLKSKDDPLNGVLKAIDEKMKWILIQSNEVDFPDLPKSESELCIMIKVDDISHISYFKCNGTGDIDESGSEKKK